MPNLGGDRMLSDKQIEQYLHRIELTEKSEPSVESLNRLIYAHQTHIPFETVGIHRKGNTPDLSVDAIFRKAVTDRNGGYCFELNKLFECLLSALGYNARPVLCRVVRGREGRMPINHRGILVELPEGIFSADVGFGGPMPAGALRLEDGLAQTIDDVEFIPVLQDNGWWRIDRITKAGADLHDDGIPSRRQTELELCEAEVEDIDFEALNCFCSLPGTLFKDHELANLLTEDGHIAYLDGKLTIRKGGNKETIMFESPCQQNAALNRYLGMDYS